MDGRQHAGGRCLRRQHVVVDDRALAEPDRHQRPCRHVRPRQPQPPDDHHRRRERPAERRERPADPAGVLDDVAVHAAAGQHLRAADRRQRSHPDAAEGLDHANQAGGIHLRQRSHRYRQDRAEPGQDAIDLSRHDVHVCGDHGLADHQRDAERRQRREHGHALHGELRLLPVDAADVVLGQAVEGARRQRPADVHVQRQQHRRQDLGGRRLESPDVDLQLRRQQAADADPVAGAHLGRGAPEHDVPVRRVRQRHEDHGRQRQVHDLPVRRQRQLHPAARPAGRHRLAHLRCQEPVAHADNVPDGRRSRPGRRHGGRRFRQRRPDHLLRLRQQ